MDISSLTPAKQVKLQYWLEVIRQRNCGFHGSGIQVSTKTELRFPSYRNAGFQFPE